MNQIGVISKPYREAGRKDVISFSFPLKGYGKVAGALSVIKKIYRGSFLHDFQNVLTSKVD